MTHAFTNTKYASITNLFSTLHNLFATLTAGDYPRGIGSYLRSDPANDVLVVRHNTDATHKLYTITEAGVTTSITTNADIASDNRMTFSNVEDVIYCMNGVDDFGKLSGTTYTTPSTGISNFSPSFAVVFAGSHWASGWSTNANIVYKSVADNYEDFNSAGSDTFTFKEQITGLSANLSSLFYFTKNTISVTGISDITDTAGTLTFANRALEVKEGAVNHACIVEAGSRTFFVTPSNKINTIALGQSIDGYDVQTLSHRKWKGIDNIMETLDNDQSDAFGYYLQEKNLIKWFFKSAGATFHDVCIIYDLQKDIFLVDSNKFFYDGVFFKNLNYTVSMIEPKVYKDEFAQDDEDTAIPFEYRTKEFYVGDPTYKKILRETRTLLDINELVCVTQEIWIDGALADTKQVCGSCNYTGGDAAGIGVPVIGEHAIGEDAPDGFFDDDLEEIYILRTAGNLNKIGRKFQLRFISNTIAGKTRLKALSMKIETKPAIATSLTKTC